MKFLCLLLDTACKYGGGKTMILPTTLAPWTSRVVKNTILYFCIKCPFNVRDTIAAR